MLTSIEEKHSQFESTTDAEDISGLVSNNITPIGYIISMLLISIAIESSIV